MRSEDVVIQSPTSYTGSRARIWRMVTGTENPALRWSLAVPTALLLILLAWSFVSAWYLLFGLFLAPWRLIRRGSRKRKRDTLRHQEVLEATRAAQGS